MPSVVELSASRAKTLIEAEQPKILDLRDARSYRAGHIAGAMLLHEGLEFSLIEARAFEEPLLLYCYRGVKSKEKAQHLVNVGFKRVYTLEQGFSAWPREARSAD